MGLTDRLQHAWNAFMNKDPTRYYPNYSASYGVRPDRVRFTRGNERSIVTSIFNRIALDVASIDIEHCRLDADGRFIETINSKFNDCLTIEANIDQTGRAFKQDIVMSMLDEGSVAIVPVDTTLDPRKTSSYDILSMRTGKVIEWYPSHVKVQLYNDKNGRKEEVVLPKSMVSIIENPLYAVVNEPNSTLQRLIRKLVLLDSIDEQSGSGKLDLIIQLPYTIKTEARRQQAILEGEILEIEEKLKRAVIIKEGKKGTVSLGSKVDFVDEATGEAFTYEIVGTTEADVESGRISNESPLGNALLGRKVGDKAIVNAPAGVTTYTVKKVY